MTTHRRVHLESKKTIIEEITEEFDAWSIRVLTEENGKPSAIFLSASTLADAQKSSDEVVQRNHSCSGRCGNWTRVLSGGRA
jgi:hypothetical protein